MTHINNTSDSVNKSTTAKQGSGYSTVWRWHFYAGLFIVPFLIMLSVTGLGMMLLANIEGRHGEIINVVEQETVQPLSVMTAAAEKAVPDGTVVQYIAPKTEDVVAVFRVNVDGDANMVAINPYTAEVLKVYPVANGWYHIMDDIHGTFLLDKKGDYLIETAASLTILMIISGWYLWWHKQKNLKSALLPKLGTKKQWWKNAHGATGAWVSVILVFFLISGLAWAGIWGSKMVQAWSQFPAGKFGNGPMPISTPLSTQTHGEALNPDGPKDVPWALELTPMPASTPTDGTQEKLVTDGNTDSSVAMQNGHISLDALDAFAREQGMLGRYQLFYPKDETSVWSISQDSMSYDTLNPTADRIIHFDQYSGQVLADIKFKDYSLFGKFMAVGIALHMGTLGWWSILANALFCFAIIFMCVGSLVMWWQRRPAKAIGLVPPKKSKQSRVGWGFLILLIAVSAMFPTALIAIVVMLMLDFIVLSRVPLLQSWFK